MTTTAVSPWDALHQQARHRLEYPSEHVVRFLAGVELDPEGHRTPRAVDIGCGSGRHSILAEQFGFKTYACDVSPDAVYATRTRWDAPAKRVVRAPMTELPYDDERFDVAIAYAVFYYGTVEEHRASVEEMRRVLRPGGRAFVCLRREDDWRAKFIYNGVFHCAGEPEDGMRMHFLTEYEVHTLYGGMFSELGCEFTETTTRNGGRRNADWLITVRK